MLDAAVYTKVLGLWSDFKLPPSVLLPILCHPELEMEMGLRKHHPEMAVSLILIQMEIHLK